MIFGFLSKNKTTLAVVALLVCFLFQTSYAAWNDSVTFDEPAHISSGYFYLKTGDYSIHSINPPVIRQLISLPLILSKWNIPLEQWSSSERHLLWERGQDILFNLGNNTDLLLFTARFPIIVLGLALGLLIFLWVKEMWGSTAGLLALFFYVLEPNILAHAHLATTDLGFVFFSMLTFYLLYRYTRNVSTGKMLLFSAALGLALGSKLSGIIFVALPCFMILFWTRVVKGKKNFRRPLKEFLAVGFVAAVTLWAIYGFSTESIIKSSGSLFTAGDFISTKWPVLSPLADVLNIVGQKAFFPPKHYLLGLWDLFQQNQVGVNSFLLGSWRSPDTLWFFPVLLILKTSLPLLVSSIGGLLILLRKKSSKAVFFTIPLLCVATFSLISQYHYGIRHTLLLYPILIIAAAFFCNGLIRTPHRQRAKRTLLVGSLLGIHLLSVSKFVPHYLTYFNEVSTAILPPYLTRTDADLDWGQGLKYLKTFMENKGIEKINLDYFGVADPKDYNINYVEVAPTTPSPGWLVISATNLPHWENYLGARKPTAIVANSMLVFYVEK